MAAQQAFRQLDFLQRQRGQARLQGRAAGKQAEHAASGALLVTQLVEQVEHAAAFGEQRLAGLMMGTNRRRHGLVGFQLGQVQLGVATWQVEAVHLGQGAVGERREVVQLGAQGLQQVEVGLVEEGECRVPRHADAHAGKQGAWLIDHWCGEAD